MNKDINRNFYCIVGKKYPQPKEMVSTKKFLSGMLSLTDPVGWLKDIASLFNLRKLTIYGIILGAVFAYAYFQGQGNTPIQTNLRYEEEHKMVLNGTYIHKPKYSHDIYLKNTKTNKILKHFKAKDFPLLAEKLKPIGFIFEPVGIMGLGAGGVENGFEAGCGISFIKYWKWRLDGFLTNRGVYVGTSYQLTDNSGLGLGVGKGFDASNRVILYYKWRF